MNAKITSIGIYLPEKEVTNRYFEKILDTSDEWIRERTGIVKRYFSADNEFTGDMCVKAARNLAETYHKDLSDVDFIIVATTTPEHSMPNVASQVQTRLGINLHCGVMDIDTACSGFCYALLAAQGLIASGACRKILVFGADTMSKILDFTDRSSCILFGDGAGCVLMEASGENYVFRGMTGTDGSYGKDLYVSTRAAQLNGVDIENNGKLHQNGRAVYRWAVTTLTNGLALLAEKNGKTLRDIDYFIPHSANYRMLESVFTSLDVPLEDCVDSVRECGNTCAASIPLAWYKGLQDGRIKIGDQLMLIGFGGGFTYAGLCVENRIEKK